MILKCKRPDASGSECGVQDLKVTDAYVANHNQTCFSYNLTDQVYRPSTAFEIEMFLGAESKTSFPSGAHVIIHNASGYKEYTDGFNVLTGNIYS